MRFSTAGSLIVWFLLSFFAATGQPYNTRLVAQLDTILKADQQYRGKPTDVAAKKWGWYSKQVNLLAQKQQKNDLLNQQKVEKMMARYGYPGKTLVGEKHQATAFLVLQHSDPETQEKYFPLLKEAADKGELKWSSLAIMVDRIRTNKGQLQVYGSQLSQEGDTAKLDPIEDEPNVNNRRAAVGLAPLEEYLKHFNISYRLPTADSNFNPLSLYSTTRKESEASAVELIGSDSLLYSQLVYPPEARKRKIEGHVTLQFTIDPAGIPKDFMVVDKLGYGCDEEAIRVMKTARFTNTSGEDHEIRMRLPFPYRK